jgi:putative FmdB family regulatory protein
MYEYKCANCGKRFESLQKFSDAPLTVHEECGSGPVERLVSAPSFNFKGTGWYVTDYAKGGNGKNAENAKPDSTSEKASGADKTESKSDSASSTPATTSTPAASTPSTSSGSDKSDK